jgi:hypothetical protein
MGFIGPRKEAGYIRDKIQWFFTNKLNLDLSMDKTLITHAKSDTAKFLGFEIGIMDNDTKIKSGKRCINGKIALRMPYDVVTKVRQRFCKEGKVLHRAELRDESDYTIINRFGSILRGLYNYYKIAGNVTQVMGTISWILKKSCLKTLANKYHSTISKILKDYYTVIDGYRALQVTIAREGKNPLVATFGGFSLRHQKIIELFNDQSWDKPWFHGAGRRSEVVQRLQAGKCELCGMTDRDKLQVHHIRKLPSLRKTNHPTWKRVMLARNRKTLVVCQGCHDDIHAGRYDGPSL